MDKTLIEYLINIIVLVPVVIILIIISLKLGRNSIDKFSVGAYAQVIERINMTKDTSLYVIKMGTTGCVLVTSGQNTQIIKELDANEVNEIVKMKKEKHKGMDLQKIPGLDISKILKDKIIRKKDDGYTK